MIPFNDPVKARAFLLKSDKDLFQGLRAEEIEKDWSDEKCLWVANGEIFLLTGQGDDFDYEAIAGMKPEK
jgi:hypothetical protein